MRAIKTEYKVGNTIIKRPKCQTKGCDKFCQNLGNPNSFGHPTFRHYCFDCHTKRREVFKKKKELVDRRSLPCCGVSGCRKRVLVTGTDRKGNLKFTKYCEDHVCIQASYSVFKKDYCENIDKRLGFKCTTTILLTAQLDVDHIDGNPFNNDPANLQTLCGCCHKYKTLTNKDYATPGRKQIRKKA